MKRFLSMLALAVLVLQSVATSAVYATDLVDPSAETESIASVETEVADPVSDESGDNVADLVEPKIVAPEAEETTPETEESVLDVEETKADVKPEEKAEEVSAQTETSVVEESAVDKDETEVVEEIKTEEEIEDVDFYLPRFGLFKSPVFTKVLSTENPKGECNSESTDTCVIDPVHTVGSLDNPGDVQITKLVETTDIDGEYKITVEVKGNPVEAVEATQNNICAVVVFDRSGSMGKGDKVEVCTEGYTAGECKEYYNRWDGGDHCIRRNGWGCQEYECKSVAGEGECKTSAQEYKKRVDAVAGAKLFATTLNNSLNHQGGDNMAKIGLVTFAGDATEGRSLDFADLSNGEFGNHDGGTNLDAGLLKAQEMLNRDEFCNTENSKKYIVAITDGAPTYAGVGKDRIGKGGNSSISTVTPKTTEDAQAIRDSGIEIFTIGYQLEEIYDFDTDNYLKNSIASYPNYAYEGENADKVAQAFQTISESIQEFAAGTEATLIDHVGNVTLVTSDENETPNELKDFTITKDGQTIEFYVKIKDGAENGEYDTNAGVYLTFTGYDSEGNPIPGKGLNITDSSKIHRVQPPCGGTKPTVVEGVTKMGAETYPRKWNDAGDALKPMGYSEWTYVEANPNLEACEWTCDGEGYVREGDTCVLKKYDITPTVKNGKINPSEKVSVNYGETKEVTYEADNEYTLKSVTVDGKEVDRNTYKEGYTFEKVTEAHTIDVVYAVDENGNGTPDDEETYTLTVTYVKADGSEAPAAHTESVLSGAEYSVTSPVVEGYVADRLIVTGTMPGENHEERVTYKVDSNGNGIADDEETYTLTVTYVKADGSEAPAAHTESVLSGAEYSVTSPVVEGYVADRLTVIGTMPGENHEERVTYKVDSNGNGIADDEEDKVAITFNAGDHGSISGEVIYTTEKNLLPGVDKYPVAPEVTAEDGWKFKEWTPTYEAEKLIPLENSTIEFTATYECDDEHHEVTTENGKYCESNVQEDVKTVEICGELDPVNNTHFVKETQTISYVSGDRQKDCNVICNDNYHPVKQADGTSEADDYMTYKCEIDTFTVTFDSNGGSAVTGQTVEYGKTATQPTNPTRNGYNFKEWRLSGSTTTFNFSTPITGDIFLVAQWDKVSNGGGGGGGGGGSSTTYECKNLPANAEANNTNKPSRNTDYTYSEEKDGLCTFHCKSGYHPNEDKTACEKDSTGGNGGGNGDEEIVLGGQVSDKCSVEGSNRSAEEIAAYLYACENDITTIRDINKARLGDFLTRAEMAKMVSVFATKELGMKPNTSKDCSNFAESIANYNQEMKDYMVMSCQLEVMGIHTTNYQAIPDFMPSKRVSRAEFGTILSRVLWGNKYEGTNENYYINHLNALKESNIITNINPNITEYRAWVFLMLYRSVEAIKIARANNNESIEQQVNEELQEEGKAETGLVVEYDSGSVVPDMATLTESGTLATGAVDEIKSGSVVETQTGATTTLTGEDISKEVTGTVVEIGSTND